MKLFFAFIFLNTSLLFAESAVYKRVKQSNQKQGWTFEIEDHKVLSQDHALSTGLQMPTDWESHAPKRYFVESRTVPDRFDWRDVLGDGLTPIKDQGSCGSCWAFATAANFADVLKIREGQTFNVSQQFLLSCNSMGYTCNGGWWAHDMHKKYGWVDAAQFPYRGGSTQCKSGLKYNDKLTSWGYVGGNGNAIPSASAIKQAIMAYGPVTVAVSASDSFMAYKSGIYNACDSTSIDHAVNLVGWDDKENYWIMRNSWGTSWGEKGFMRIRQGCNAIGTGASFVDYQPKCANQPFVDVGLNQIIHAGESVMLGGIPMVDATYRWLPAEGLTETDVPNPTVSPKKDTVYTVVVSTSCGASAASVKVSIAK